MGSKKRSKAVPRQPHSGVADALFTKVQQRVLAVLFGNPSRSFYANEIIAMARTGTGAVQRELAHLEAAGLVTVVRVGNQKHYQANANTPVFKELRSLVLKTSGLADILRAALAPSADKISTAFVYGSIAKGEDTAKSDIDLMVISDTLSYPDLYASLEEATRRLGRTVNPTVYKPQDLDKRFKEGNAFIQRVMAQPKIWLMGEKLEPAT
jgi:predicted nucleotidyltransferase